MKYKHRMRVKPLYLFNIASIHSIWNENNLGYSIRNITILSWISSTSEDRYSKKHPLQVSGYIPFNTFKF